MNFFETQPEPNPEAKVLPIPSRVDPGHGSDPDQSRAVARTTLPPWLAEKYHWHTTASGFTRLRPNDEFLNGVIADAPKFEAYGYKLVHPEGGAGAVESDLVASLKGELKSLLDSLTALQDREAADFIRWLTDRACRNQIYAAITQFELDNWAARAAAQGRNPAEHENFGEKESRRDTFSITGAVYAEVLRELKPDVDLGDEAYARSARQVIYNQANMQTRETLNPQQEKQQESAEIAAAVLASRPI